MPCHKRDWKQYNKQLINRGNLNFWIPKKSLKFWKAKKSKKVGRPFTYSDEAIQTMLIVRFKYQLPLRELEGLFQFLAKLQGIPEVPSYTQVCRRMQNLQLPEELTSPNRKAILRKEEVYKDRNQALGAIKGLGGDELARTIWGKLSGYSKRVLVESKIAAWKQMLGADLKSKTRNRVKNEVRLKAMIFNQMVAG